MTPTQPGYFWQHNPVNGAYRPVEVKWFDYTGCAADSTAKTPKDAPPGYLWAVCGSASWWNMDEGGQGFAGWVWDDPVLNPDEVRNLVLIAEEAVAK